MRRHWTLISADDPRNAVFAEWAGTCATLQWTLILAALALAERHADTPFHWRLSVTALSLILLSIGWRGWVWGGAKRLGSIVLATTNLLIFLMFATSIVLDYVAYHHG